MNTLDSKLKSFRIIPVIAIDNATDILPLGKELVSNGLPVAEITFRSDAAIEALTLLRQEYPDMLIGAGTVLTEAQVIAAKNSGADFIVSPGLNPNTVRACQKHDIAIIPGINNPSQIEQALELGLTTVKYFPAEASGGVTMLKALLGPYSNINVMPTGGVSVNNIHQYLEIPSVLACGGTWMVDKKLINSGEWSKIGTLVKEIVKSLDNS